MANNENYLAWNIEGQPISVVGQKFLSPIADKLGQINQYIFGDQTFFPNAPKPHSDFCNVIEIVEPKPIWMPRPDPAPILPREEVLDLLKHPAGSNKSPLLPKCFVEGKLDEVRCYMVVWSQHADGYIGYDLGLFIGDKFSQLKGKAVIHDIVCGWAYTHRKSWLEMNNFLPFIELSRHLGGLSDNECVFVNRKIEPNANWQDYEKQVSEAVDCVSNPSSPVHWFNGIIIKPRFHHYRACYIEPSELGETQTVNVGDWRKLCWN